MDNNMPMMAEMPGMSGMGSYTPPKALTALAWIFLAAGGICALVVIVEILARKRWKTMMAIMIPTYVITATYMGPVGLYLYFRYGREPGGTVEETGISTPAKVTDTAHILRRYEEMLAKTKDYGGKQEDTRSELPDLEQRLRPEDATRRSDSLPASAISSSKTDSVQAPEDIHQHQHHQHHTHRQLPKLVSAMIGVSHCGAGCVLGDLVGEWLVYSTGTTLAGSHLWAMILVNYAFALLFGFFFQYLAIAAVSHDYSVKSVVRAVKADILSLTAFEVGLAGWMIAFDLGIFRSMLEMSTWTYWWMMQVGMFLGFWTAVPVNLWLVSRGVIEPCA